MPTKAVYGSAICGGYYLTPKSKDKISPSSGLNTSGGVEPPPSVIPTLTRRPSVAADHIGL